MTGLGTLTNHIAEPTSPNSAVKKALKTSRLRTSNATKTFNTGWLTQVNNKPLYYKHMGTKAGPPIVFIHGSGTSSEYFKPLIQALQLETSHSLHLFDLEGLGLSPTSPLSKVSIQSAADDVSGIFEFAKISSQATLIASSTGCLIAMHFAVTNPHKISKLILVGPPPTPLSETTKGALYNLADEVRMGGMAALVDNIFEREISTKTKDESPLAVAAIRMSLLNQDPEGYAKACTAYADAPSPDSGAIAAKTLIILSSTAPAQLREQYVAAIKGETRLCVLDDVGSWHIFEDLPGVAHAVEKFLDMI